MEETTRVGLIGLGLVGKAVAARMLTAGCSVAGYDIDEGAREEARALGVAVASTPTALPGRCGVILLSLPNSDVVDVALWGPDGIAPACVEGHVIFDTTTSRPSETIDRHERLSERGVDFVDVPLVGSSREIADGEAVALVGATEEDFPLAELVATFAKRTYYFGAPGQGHRAKLVVNLVLGLNRLVLAEGLALSEKLGMDARAMLDVLRNSAAYSRAMDAKGAKMLDRDFEPAARLAQHTKDVGLILELAEASGAHAPLSTLHAELLKQAIEAGLGPLDNSAIIETFRAR
ncbi:MAG: NAD-binding protein [Nitrospiraceae bacterium]|nr:NAD-binding protein [Nitrospiraceae bacterium]